MKYDIPLILLPLDIFVHLFGPVAYRLRNLVLRCSAPFWMMWYSNSTECSWTETFQILASKTATDFVFLHLTFSKLLQFQFCFSEQHFFVGKLTCTILNSSGDGSNAGNRLLLTCYVRLVTVEPDRIGRHVVTSNWIALRERRHGIAIFYEGGCCIFSTILLSECRWLLVRIVIAREAKKSVQQLIRSFGLRYALVQYSMYLVE